MSCLASIRISMTPLGFNASVRGRAGSWYIDPYYHLDQSVYASYFKDQPPARSTVQVSALPKGAQVEIDVIAVI